MFFLTTSTLAARPNQVQSVLLPDEVLKSQPKQVKKKSALLLTRTFLNYLRHRLKFLKLLSTATFVYDLSFQGVSTSSHVVRKEHVQRTNSNIHSTV